jgi:hypothetical protein
MNTTVDDPGSTLALAVMSVADGEELDLATAHSQLDGNQSPAESAAESGLDLDAQIQQMFANSLDDEMRNQFSTGLVLDAIEAQIDDVIRAIGQDGDGTSAMDAAILARFRAKNLSVEEATGCAAADLPPSQRQLPPKPAIPLSPHGWKYDAVIAALCSIITPCLLLALVLFLYTRAEWDLCGYECPCTMGQAAQFSATFHLLLQAPRCFLFGFFTDELICASQEKDGNLSCFPKLTKMKPWLLGLSALIASVIGEMIANGTGAPLYVMIPIRVVTIAIPFTIYCVLRRTLMCAAPVVWLQLLPVFYQILVPQTFDLPTALVVIWPVVAAFIDRAFLYALLAMMPSQAAQPRTIAVHVASFYSQALTATMPLALDLKDAPWLLVIYAVLLCLVEFLLSAHWIDQLILAVANRIAGLSKKGELHFGSYDLRLMSSYSRHFTYLLVVCVMVPLLAIKQWPVAHRVNRCDGVPHSRVSWWTVWGAVVGAFVVSVLATTARRHFAGAMKRPLLVSCPMWAFATALYLAFLSPESFAYLPRS